MNKCYGMNFNEKLKKKDIDYGVMSFFLGH